MTGSLRLSRNFQVQLQVPVQKFEGTSSRLLLVLSLLVVAYSARASFKKLLVGVPVGPGARAGLSGPHLLVAGGLRVRLRLPALTPPTSTITAAISVTVGPVFYGLLVKCSAMSLFERS